jgi:signal transduction histidine kinase
MRTGNVGAAQPVRAKNMYPSSGAAPSLSAATRANRFVRRDESETAQGMNPGAEPGATFGASMQVARRLSGLDLDLVADAGVTIAGVGLAAFAMWSPWGAAVIGPVWLRAVLPLLLGGPLVLRRRAPVAMWIGIWAAVAFQYAITGHPPEALELFVPIAGAYSLGALVIFPRSAVCLAASLVMIMAARPGLAIIPLLAAWLAGVFVQTRGWAASLTAKNAALQQQAERTAAYERARIARELHDIVAHHLSVIVLQAAGARVSGTNPEKTLEKIESSGRQALAETRRLLDVLRDPDQENGLAPQPSIDELDSLAGSVRAAGVPVNLVVSGDRAALPAAVDVSVYRIVQEALTNVLKHAGHARADVTIGCTADAVTIDVIDDGSNQSANGAPVGRHGLVGMRERVAVFGGDLHVGPRSNGGYAVHARLPLSGSRARDANPT